MVWSGEPGEQEQARNRWYSRFAAERLGLSASVEAALADGSVQEDLLSDELDDTDEPDETKKSAQDAQAPRSTAIIPPKLSLQSKAMAVVRVEPQQSTGLVVVDAPPASHPEETRQTPQKKQRLAGRTTRVRLQSVPKAEKRPAASTPAELHNGTNTAHDRSQTEAINSVKHTSTSHMVEKPSKITTPTTPIAPATPTTANGKLSGNAVFERGQSEVTIANALITGMSVVVVTLIGDPGPVVVQYVSLQPQVGFTVHLSAPAQKKTRFNYVVLLGELF